MDFPVHQVTWAKGDEYKYKRRYYQSIKWKIQRNELWRIMVNVMKANKLPLLF